ncbi:MAG: PorV/PorQ family protein [archaeon]
MKKITLLLLILLSAEMFSQDFRKTGTAGYTFLEIPVTARNAALGESSISLSDMNSSAVFSNPGALGFQKQNHSLSISYSPWFAEIKHYAAGYSFASDLGVIGIGAIALDYGSMPRTVRLSGQRVFEQTGMFSANSMALGLTYSKQLTDKFSFGITAKYVNEKIDVYSSSNVLMDGGFLYYTGLSSLRLGASITNFGTNSKFKNSEFKMPAMFRIGAAAEVYQSGKNSVTLLVEAVHPTDADERVNAGTEIKLMDVLVLRGGYKFFYDEEKFSYGIGLALPVDYPVNVDFSMSDYGRLGNILRLTLQFGML